jgi:hypothetical protein
VVRNWIDANLLTNVKDGSKITLVDAWKPYASDIDLKYIGFDYKRMDLLTSDAFLSTYVAIRKFESECHRNIDIRLIRADSDTMLPCLCADSFDFIYIDGDHKYEKAKSDIQNAKRLVKKDYGIICGDDLDRHPAVDLIETAKSFRNQDYLGEPHHFHPGVLLAVSEEFSRVSMVNGFRWVVCRNDVFTDT